MSLSGTEIFQTLFFLMKTNSRSPFDVCIVGSGLYGSTLACILAKHGLRTLILEPGRHP